MHSTLHLHIKSYARVAVCKDGDHFCFPAGASVSPRHGDTTVPRQAEDAEAWMHWATQMAGWLKPIETLQLGMCTNGSAPESASKMHENVYTGKPVNTLHHQWLRVFINYPLTSNGFTPHQSPSGGCPSTVHQAHESLHRRLAKLRTTRSQLHWWFHVMTPCSNWTWWILIIEHSGSWSTHMIHLLVNYPAWQWRRIIIRPWTSHLPYRSIINHTSSLLCSHPWIS